MLVSQALHQGLLREPGAEYHQRLHRGNLKEFVDCLVKERVFISFRFVHLALRVSRDSRNLLETVLASHGYDGLSVLYRHEQDRGLLTRFDRSLDPLQMGLFPIRLDDGHSVTDTNHECVMLSDILWARFDLTQEPQPVVVLVKLDLLDSNAELHSSLLGTFRSELVALLLLSPEGHGINQIGLIQQVAEVPQIIGGLGQQLDLVRSGVLM